MSTYICEGAMMRCCFGSAPACLRVSTVRNVALTNARHANIADHEPFENIPSFGICHKDGSHPKPCSPGTMCLWEGGNYDYLIRNYPALLYTSYCKCINGGIIKFVKDGQTKGEFDMSRNSDGQGMRLREDDEAEFPSELVLDAIEFIPVIGSIVGIGRSAMKGDWAMVGLNAGFLALDVFTIGAGSTAAKVGVKAASKVAAKGGTKVVQKTAKTITEGMGKQMSKQTSENTSATFSQLLLKDRTKETGKQAAEKTFEKWLGEIVVSDETKKISITEVSKGAGTINKAAPKLFENVGKQLLDGTKFLTKELLDTSQLFLEKSVEGTKNLFKEIIENSVIKQIERRNEIRATIEAEEIIYRGTKDTMLADEALRMDKLGKNIEYLN